MSFQEASEKGALRWDEVLSESKGFWISMVPTQFKDSYFLKVWVGWFREGDSNTCYFHACVKSTRKRNVISTLRVDNG